MRIANRVAAAVSLLFCAILVLLVLALWIQMEKAISEAMLKQHFAVLEASADDLDSRLSNSHAVLIAAAQSISAETLSNIDQAQAWLDSREGLTALFDDHLYLFSPTGDILVEAPFTPGRRGKNIAFRPYFQKTISNLEPVISDPFQTTLDHHHPTVMMTVPIFDRAHKLIAVLGGSIDLLENNLIGRIGERGIRLGGYYALVNLQRTVLAHPDRSRIFMTLSPGDNVVLDMALDGFEGTSERTNHLGVEVFTSVKRLHSVPWLLMLSYPRREVFAGLYPILYWLPALALVAILFSVAIVRALVTRQLAPLSSVIEHLAGIGNKMGEDRFLSVSGGGEFALLGETFNRLIRSLDEKGEDLAAKEQLYRTVAEFTSDTVFWRGADGRLIYVSDNVLNLTGYPAQKYMDQPELLDEIVLPEDTQVWDKHVHQIDADGWTRPLEFRIKTAAGEIRWVSHVCHPVLGSAGEFLGYRGSHRDITRDKLEERRQRLAASVFFSARESIMVTNAQGEIQMVNPAFTAMSGYLESEIVGKTPRVLKSGVHSAGFYEEFWQMLLHHGCWQGEVTNRHRNGELFVASTHIEAVRDAAGQLIHYICGQTDVTRLKKVENHMAFLLHHDALTGLTNRAALEQLGDQILGSGRSGDLQSCLMFIDVDRFKDVNESLGHALGDLLLIQFAQRLQRLARTTDIVARVGGDEFGLVFPGVERQMARTLAEKIQAGLRDPFVVDEHHLSLTVSIGIAIYPEDGNTTGELLKNADTALYEAKQEGRNAIVFYRPAMNEATYGLLLLETELRRALCEGKLETYYQPKLDLSSGEPVGAEALIRWNHPERGLIPPGEFIPAAERSGLINEIGEWVLSDVCRQQAEWRADGCKLFPVAVNLSARQFRSPNLPARVAELLEEYELDASMIELELTETTLLIAGHQVMENLAALHSMGVALAIDDFGTGYSSLSYLKKMPISTLKIDQSFVRDLQNSTDDQALVNSIVSLGHSLGLTVVAEGVETDEQASMLNQRGCDIAQGYLYARPMPAANYLDWLSSATRPQAAF